jgi:hypothetical protein
MDGLSDFDKVYDKVKWSFLQQALRIKCFPPLWYEWIAGFMQDGCVGIRVNDDHGHYIEPLKG